MPRGGARPGAGRKPGKVSKAKRDISELAKEHGRAALQTLVDVANDEEAPHSARVSAANGLLDRGYGKPPQSLLHGGDAENPVKVITQIERRIVKAGD